MTRRAPALLLLMLAALAGCGTTPRTTWYLLEATGAPGAAADGPRIGIARLEVAEYLLSPQIQTRDGPNTVQRAGFAQWAEPIDKGVARVLLLDLAAAAGTERVRLAPWPRDWVPEREVMVRIERLDASETVAELVATWSVQDGARKTPARDRLARISMPRSGNDGSAVAADLSALLNELALRISTDIAADAAHAGDAAGASD
jgi:hypothetical protein